MIRRFRLESKAIFTVQYCHNSTISGAERTGPLVDACRSIAYTVHLSDSVAVIGLHGEGLLALA